MARGSEEDLALEQIRVFLNDVWYRLWLDLTVLDEGLFSPYMSP